MICMGEAGMKRVLFKIIVPVLILVLWILMCYPVCQQENGFDYFLFWIMVGFPYGIRKMCMFFIPKNFGIAGSIDQKWEGESMESMRDINRVMEREIAKGSSPLKLDHIEFGDYSYQEITSEKKLEDVLSYLLRIRDFRQYAGKTILNNVYMDLRGRKPVFKRTRTAIERNNIFTTIKRHAKKLKPQYNGDVYLETVRCYFDIPQENLEKCRYTYQGNETYAFLMSDKYIMALYTHCLVARKEAAIQGDQVDGFTEKEYGMVRLENVRDVLFQALLLDAINFENGKVQADLCIITRLKDSVLV